jgi:microcystin-dependent protein
MMDDAYIGEIRYFAGSYVPEGWYACDGKTYNVQDEQVLYAVIGPKYGGDSRTKFAVPNIEDLNGCRAIICRDGRFPPRS